MCLLYMKYVLDHIKSLRGNDQPAHRPTKQQTHLAANVFMCLLIHI